MTFGDEQSAASATCHRDIMSPTSVYLSEVHHLHLPSKPEFTDVIYYISLALKDASFI